MGMSGGEGNESFEQRLAKARGSAGMDRPPSNGKPPDNSDGNAIRLAMRLGVELFAALVIAVVIGWGLDRLFHTRPWIMIAFVPIGAAAGIRNLIRAVGSGDKS
jgi:ATP synthase protein I